jgi:hypothetical protein
LNSGRWIQSWNPAVLLYVHHCQNPLDPIWKSVSKAMNQYWTWYCILLQQPSWVPWSISFINAFLENSFQGCAPNDWAEPQSHKHTHLVCLSASSSCLKSRPWQTIAIIGALGLALSFSEFNAFSTPPPPRHHIVICESIATFARSVNVSHFGFSDSSADCPPIPLSLLCLAVALIAKGPASGDMTRDIGPFPLQTQPAVWYLHHVAERIQIHKQLV